MAIPVPIGLIWNSVKWVYERAIRWLFISTYRTSHQYWAKRHQWGAHWESLNGDVEYALHLAQFTDAEPRVSKIAFRSKNKVISRLAVLLEAEGNGIRYQESIEIKDVNSRPISFSLSLPYVDAVLTSSRDVRFTIESYLFRGGEMQFEDGSIVSFGESLEFSLTQSWFLNEEWIFKWGIWWNCNEIKWAKSRISQYWLFRFGRPEVIVYSPFADEGSKRSLVEILSGLIGSIMATPPLVAVQFWAAIWSRLFVLTEDGLARKSRDKREDDAM